MHSNPPRCTIVGCNGTLDIRDYLPKEWFDDETVPEMWLEDGYWFCDRLEQLVQKSGFSNRKTIFDFR
jgi:hypothetical protein